MYTVNALLSAEMSIKEMQWQADARCADESVMGQAPENVFFSEELQDIAAAHERQGHCDQAPSGSAAEGGTSRGRDSLHPGARAPPAHLAHRVGAAA